MNEELLKQMNQNLENAVQSFNSSYEQLMKTVDSIDNEDYNLETKFYIIKGTLRNMSKLLGMSFNMIVATSKLQQSIVEKTM